MAKIKARMPVVATRTETPASGSTPASVAFSAGLAIGKLVQAQVNPNVSDVKFYADDGIAEHDISFNDASITVNVSTIPTAVAEKLWDADWDSTNHKLTWYDKRAKYVGFGFISAEMIDNTESYKVTWLPKVIFALPSEQYDTKGESVTFNASSLTGTAEKDPYNTDTGGEECWKEEYFYSTAADAITQLKSLAGIS